MANATIGGKGAGTYKPAPIVKATIGSGGGSSGGGLPSHYVGEKPLYDWEKKGDKIIITPPKSGGGGGSSGGGSSGGGSSESGLVWKEFDVTPKGETLKQVTYYTGGIGGTQVGQITYGIGGQPIYTEALSGKTIQFTEQTKGGKIISTLSPTDFYRTQVTNILSPTISPTMSQVKEAKYNLPPNLILPDKQITLPYQYRGTMLNLTPEELRRIQKEVEQKEKLLSYIDMPSNVYLKVRDERARKLAEEGYSGKFVSPGDAGYQTSGTSYYEPPRPLTADELLSLPGLVVREKGTNRQIDIGAGEDKFLANEYIRIQSLVEESANRAAESYSSGMRNEIENYRNELQSKADSGFFTVDDANDMLDKFIDKKSDELNSMVNKDIDFIIEKELVRLPIRINKAREKRYWKDVGASIVAKIPETYLIGVAFGAATASYALFKGTAAAATIGGRLFTNVAVPAGQVLLGGKIAYDIGKEAGLGIGELSVGFGGPANTFSFFKGMAKTDMAVPAGQVLLGGKRDYDIGKETRSYIEKFNPEELKRGAGTFTGLTAEIGAFTAGAMTYGKLIEEPKIRRAIEKAEPIIKESMYRNVDAVLAKYKFDKDTKIEIKKLVEGSMPSDGGLSVVAWELKPKAGASASDIRNLPKVFVQELVIKDSVGNVVKSIGLGQYVLQQSGKIYTREAISQAVGVLNEKRLSTARVVFEGELRDGRFKLLNQYKYLEDTEIIKSQAKLKSDIINKEGIRVTKYDEGIIAQTTSKLLSKEKPKVASVDLITGRILEKPGKRIIELAKEPRRTVDLITGRVIEKPKMKVEPKVKPKESDLISSLFKKQKEFPKEKSVSNLISGLREVKPIKETKFEMGAIQKVEKQQAKIPTREKIIEGVEIERGGFAVGFKTTFGKLIGIKEIRTPTKTKKTRTRIVESAVKPSGKQKDSISKYEPKKESAAQEEIPKMVGGEGGTYDQFIHGYGYGQFGRYKESLIGQTNVGAAKEISGINVALGKEIFKGMVKPPQIVGGFILPTKTKEGTRTDNIFGVTSNFKLGTADMQITKTKEKEREKITPLITPITISGTEERVDTGIGIIPAVIPAIREKQKLKLKVEAKLKVQPPSFGFNYNIKRPPQPPPGIISFSLDDDYYNGKLTLGFIPEAKVRGKYVALSKPVSKQRALEIGKTFADVTLSRTFRVVPTKVKVKSKRTIFSQDLYKFRSFKQRAGKKIPLQDTYIERAKYALERPEQRIIKPLARKGMAFSKRLNRGINSVFRL